MKLILENWRKYLAEAKVYTPEEVRSAFFPSMPDHVFNDMKREGFGSFLEDRADDIEEQGLEKILTTDEYGKAWYDRYNLNWAQDAQILDISWEDIGAKERKFLMDKYKGKNPGFPKADQERRYADMMQRFPGLGTGDHEPVIVKMEDGKIVDIIGGRHRTFAAFLKNDFKPIKLNAYVGTEEEDGDESLPPELRNLPQHIKDTIPADIRKKYMKGYPKLAPGERIKTDSVWEGTVGASPAQIPAGTLLTVEQETREGRYSFKVDQPTPIKVGMSFEREVTISPDDELVVAGYQLWKHTPVGEEEMKPILENWRKFLNEEKKGVYSFDYDETLVKYKPDPEDPQFSVLYDGPHEENIAKLRELAAAGETVIIVTSRAKRTGDKRPWDTAPDPEDLVAELDLPLTPVLDPGDDENEADEEPQTIHYTNGDLKAPKLLRLGVIKHWDDDLDEIAAAQEAGIEAIFVPGDKEIREAMLSMWANKLQEAGVKVSKKMENYLRNHGYMEPDGLQ